MHTITIDLKQYTAEYQKNKEENKRILIAEPEPDIQVLYTLFTKQYGFEEWDVNVIKDDNKCLDILLSNTAEKEEEEDDYDIIILDTHLPDISGFEVARKIRLRLPYKIIILNITCSLANISNMIESIGIKSQDVILKPFFFSKLFSILKNQEHHTTSLN